MKKRFSSFLLLLLFGVLLFFPLTEDAGAYVRCYTYPNQIYVHDGTWGGCGFSGSSDCYDCICYFMGQPTSC
jgi:hypothetical protein